MVKPGLQHSHWGVQWTLGLNSPHIYALELKAPIILLSIQSLGIEINNKHIRVGLDSTIAAAYNNKMGGPV